MSRPARVEAPSLTVGLPPLLFLAKHLPAPSLRVYFPCGRAVVHTFEKPQDGEPPALHDRAMDNLRFIRETMERASSFTAVPGWGGVKMGVTALCASFVAALQTTRNLWLATWVVEAMLALIIGGWAMDRKARASATP